MTATSETNPAMKTYRVTIRLEKIRGEQWFVARDDSGAWRTKGRRELCLAEHGEELVASLFHREEIVSVHVETTQTVAIIREF